MKRKRMRKNTMRKKSNVDINHHSNVCSSNEKKSIISFVVFFWLSAAFLFVSILFQSLLELGIPTEFPPERNIISKGIVDVEDKKC